MSRSAPGDDVRAPTSRDVVASLYDRWSATYDSDANRTRDLAAAVLREQLGGSVGGEVLELGCGTGRNTAWLAERADAVVALDFSEGMLERARARVTGGRVKFLTHDVRERLPLEAGSADLAVAMLVLEHVEAVGPVMAECARVLRSGGRVFVCELHPYRQWEGVQARFTEAGAAQPVRVPAHVHEVSEYVNAGLAAGLRLEHLGEWRDAVDEAEEARPRLLSVTFRCG